MTGYPPPSVPSRRHYEPGAAKPWGQALKPDRRDSYHYGARDHGVLDTRDRAVGGYVQIELEIITDWRAKTTQITGRWITRTVATRDGRQFGAIAKSKTHPTNSAAEAWAEKTLIRQARRYKAKFG